MKYLSFFIIASLINITAFAQEDSIAPPPNLVMSKSDSLKMILNKAKAAFTNISKLLLAKRDTMTIMIPEIDYDNNSLTELKENLKKMRGVKSVVMHYNASTATIEVACKGKPTDVWDNVSTDVKTKFKLMEAGDNNIILKYKLAK
jgi:hypothetical protein